MTDSVHTQAEPAPTLGARLRRWLDHIEFALALIGLAAIIVLCLMTAADVLLRALNVGSNALTLQFSGYAMLAVAFLPAPWVLRRGQQISADLLAGRLPPRVARAIQYGCYIVAATACAVAAAASIMYVNGLRVDEVIDRLTVAVPRWLPLLPMPIAFTLLAVEFAYLVWRMARAGSDVPAESSAESADPPSASL